MVVERAVGLGGPIERKRSGDDRTPSSIPARCLDCEADARSGVSSEGLVHALDRRSTLAHRRGAALHRTGAHVARSKDARQARLQRPWRTAYARPRGRGDDRVAGFDETILIALDLRRQPSGAWLSTNHRKDGRRLHGSSFVRLRVLQLDGLENLPVPRRSDDVKLAHNDYASLIRFDGVPL
jgi:hypothetical protein